MRNKHRDGESYFYGSNSVFKYNKGKIKESTPFAWSSVVNNLRREEVTSCCLNSTYKPVSTFYLSNSVFCFVLSFYWFSLYSKSFILILSIFHLFIIIIILTLLSWVRWNLLWQNFNILMLKFCHNKLQPNMIFIED